MDTVICGDFEEPGVKAPGIFILGRFPTPTARTCHPMRPPRMGSTSPTLEECIAEKPCR